MKFLLNRKLGFNLKFNENIIYFKRIISYNMGIITYLVEKSFLDKKLRKSNSILDSYTTKHFYYTKRVET